MIYLIGQNDACSLTHVTMLTKTAGKFIVLGNGDIVFAAYEDAEWHRDIAAAHFKLTGERCRVESGGHWKMLNDEVELYGYSGDFGRFDTTVVAGMVPILESVLHAKHITIN